MSTPLPPQVEKYMAYFLHVFRAVVRWRPDYPKARLFGCLA